MTVAVTKQTESVYGTARWKKLRDWYFRNNPLCEMCSKPTPAYLVDHIVEISDGGERFSSDNLQSLCRRCHARKTENAKKERL